MKMTLHCAILTATACLSLMDSTVVAQTVAPHSDARHANSSGSSDHQPDPALTPYEAPTPDRAFSGPRHAANIYYDDTEMEEARANLQEDQGGTTAYKIMIDRLETRIKDGDNVYLWEGQAWYGGDYNKIWVKSEGEGLFNGALESGEIQALWSRAVRPFWDFQAGIRYDFAPNGEERKHVAFGFQGLAPYFFEVDSAVFVSTEGEVTARIEAEYDQLLTQKLILQPRGELNFSAENIPELGIGSGLSTIELGLRLRYEFIPEIAPYVGVSYETKVGDTANIARQQDEDIDNWFAVLGIRTWF